MTIRENRIIGGDRAVAVHTPLSDRERALRRLRDPSHAIEVQIQSAYRELMKRYHPDRVGRPGTREWQDAQGIAEAINRAKRDLLARAKRS
jgi:DnaJ-domain-containing protein 1